MEAISLRKYETLSPFEIKDELIKIARRTTSPVQPGLSQCRTRQSELDRDATARGLLSARPVRDHREHPGHGPACGRRRHATGARDRRAS